MGTSAEYDILAKVCHGIGINICCQHTQIGDSIGVDVDANARAAKVIADVRALPFRTGSLDYAICHHGLEHIRDAPLYVVHEWLRIVKVGGVLAVIVPDGDAGESALNYASFRGEATEYGHGHLFTKNGLKEIVKFAGGDIQSCRYLDSPERTGKSILVVATKSKRHTPSFVPYSKPVEIFRMVQKNGIWKCFKRFIRRMRCLGLLGLLILVSGCAGSPGKLSPPVLTAGRFPTPANVYERYIDIHRVGLIFEFGHVPKPEEIMNWETRFCEWDKQ